MIEQNWVINIVEHSKKDWEYQVVFPKTPPISLSRNLKFLKGFLKERKYYSQWYITLLSIDFSVFGSCPVDHLASTFVNNTDPLLIKPLIYHLIAKGTLITNLNELISSRSIILLNTQVNPQVEKIDGGMLYGI
ncbi:hypothetical protein [Paenibacillus polymyxa]|uniref:Uncharacterized protein n=1 Tax=Paenibacillus polymyxa TaxID=1406 RepID=A0AAE9IC38_PAEPO|nr:hypothetical protein [Paenibacillus polymyxa]URJ51945.1 hypothetical protein MF626_001411 [Paenibacillus polymyxa]